MVKRKPLTLHGTEPRLSTVRRQPLPPKAFTVRTEFLILRRGCGIYCTLKYGHLGGVVVSMLGTGPMGRGIKPGRGDGFLMAINILSTPSFGCEVKPEVPC
jgi:hypothetical protein